MAEELLNCPFCGQNPKASVSSRGGYLVACYRCGGDGPVANTMADAIAAWNRRTTPKPTGTEGGVTEPRYHAVAEAVKMADRQMGTLRDALAKPDVAEGEKPAPGGDWWARMTDATTRQKSLEDALEDVEFEIKDLLAERDGEAE